jgi:tRNA-binding EMAP/Myf-like protein
LLPACVLSGEAFKSLSALVFAVTVDLVALRLVVVVLNFLKAVNFRK